MLRPSLTRRALLKRVPATLVLPAFAGANLLFSESAEAAIVSGVTGVVNTPGGYLNIRSGVGTGQQVLRQANHGSTLAILQTSSDWFKVSSGGVAGWAHSDYVTVSGTPSRLILRGQEWRPRVALTFDASNDAGQIERILNVLATYGVKGSFGFTGSWAKRYPGHLQRVVADGHQLLNHGLNHISFTGFSTGQAPLSPAKRLAQLIATEEIYIDLTGTGSGAYWRPPYNDYDARALREAGAIGYSRTVLCNVDSMGWAGLSANQIFNRVVGGANNGAIIKFHIGDGARDADALESIIQRLQSDGYQFGTVRQTIN